MAIGLLEGRPMAYPAWCRGGAAPFRGQYFKPCSAPGTDQCHGVMGGSGYLRRS